MMLGCSIMYVRVSLQFFRGNKGYQAVGIRFLVSGLGGISASGY